jgi:hypothetical protein
MAPFLFPFVNFLHNEYSNFLSSPFLSSYCLSNLLFLSTFFFFLELLHNNPHGSSPLN